MKKNIALALNAQTNSFARLRNFVIKYTPVISSYLLAALFLYAAYNKLIIYKRFVKQLNNSELLTDLHNHIPLTIGFMEFGIIGLLLFKQYRAKALWASFALLLLFTGYTYLFPNALSKPYLPNFLAWFVPGVEILAAVALVLSKTRLMGLYTSFFTMLAFTAYVYVLPHFYNGGCSCGGIISTFTWKQHFWFNVAFTALAGIGLCLLPPKPTKENI